MKKRLAKFKESFWPFWAIARDPVVAMTSWILYNTGHALDQSMSGPPYWILMASEILFSVAIINYLLVGAEMIAIQRRVREVVGKHNEYASGMNDLIKEIHHER